MDETYGRRRVLLVEDNSDDEHLTLRGLKRCVSPPEVEVARDGSQAVAMMLEKAEANVRPDLILLDLKLPKLSGIEVLKRLRQHPATQSVPIVILTSSDEESDVQRCYAEGANSYVCKPVDYQAFLNAVRAVGDFWLGVTRLPSGSKISSEYLA